VLIAPADEAGTDQAGTSQRGDQRQDRTRAAAPVPRRAPGTGGDAADRSLSSCGPGSRRVTSGEATRLGLGLWREASDVGDRRQAAVDADPPSLHQLAC